MVEIILEGTITLAIFSALALFFLIVYWRKTGKPRPLLIGIGVIIVLFVIQAAVTTSREHVAATLKRVANDILASKVDALEQALASDFHTATMDRAAFVEYVRARLAEVEVHWLRQNSLRVRRTSGSMLDVSVGYIAGVTTRGFTGTVRSRWSITFVKEGGQWRIGGIDPPMIEGEQQREWGQLGR